MSRRIDPDKLTKADAEWLTRNGKGYIVAEAKARAAAEKQATEKPAE